MSDERGPVRRPPYPALSIRQPWAELILRGRKTIELREFTTSYRGPLYLHTGKVADGHRHITYGMPDVFRGGYVGLVELSGVVPMTSERWEAWRERHLSDGSYRPGLYAWLLRAPRRLRDPLPGRGQIGLYHPTEDVLDALSVAPLEDE